jgi:hypothetical protein
MTQDKIPSFMFGAAAGMAAAASGIGLVLVVLAAVLSFQSGVTALTRHPLFNMGSDLVLTGILAALPLFLIWYLRRAK